MSHSATSAIPLYALLTAVLLAPTHVYAASIVVPEERVQTIELSPEAEKAIKRGLAYLHLNEPNWAGGDITFPDGFREQMRERFSGDVLAQAGNAAFAAATAASMSASVDCTTSAITSPVAGLNTGLNSLLSLSTICPLIKL